MNTPTPLQRCPVCSAEIPADAPQGLCPKCLLQQVASVVPEAPVAPSFQTPGSAGTPEVAEERLDTSARNAPGRGAKSGSDRPSPPSVPAIAMAFPQLEILELIGRGGMGYVYKARQTKLDRFVALKILPGHLANEPSFHERFEREARVLAKLQHPLIVSIYDFGEAEIPESKSVRMADSTVPEAASFSSREQSYYYLLQEYVDGVNLREAMRAGRFTPEQALSIVPQVCDALQYAHSKGVLHRDIKPENILLDLDGRVKIADFGIAKVLGPDFDRAGQPAGAASESELAVTRLTATGSILGTPLYMAPEQLISPNAVDHRADIYSLGVVFYEMLTGELPMGRFAPPSERSNIDERIDEIVLRALAKERELRQQSADEMKTEVESIIAHPRAQSTGTDKSPRKQSTVPAAVAAPPVSKPATGIRNLREESAASANDENASGRQGWWSLAALAVGIPLAISPVVGWKAERIEGHANATAAPVWAILLMIVLTATGAFTPIGLGWRHLLRQRRDRRRSGIVPALIAAWLLPLLILDAVMFDTINLPLERLRETSGNQIVIIMGQYFAALVCLIVDGLIAAATWHWATRTLSNWRLLANPMHHVASDQAARRTWGLGLVILAILLAVAWGGYVSYENRRLTERWFRDITSAQHQWQEVSGELNLIEARRKRRPFSAEAMTPETRAAEQARADRELKEYTALRDRIAELNGRMAVLSRMGDYRSGQASYFPIALFAIPLGMTGMILLLDRQRLWASIGAAVSFLVVVFLTVQWMLEHMSGWNADS